MNTFSERSRQKAAAVGIVAVWLAFVAVAGAVAVERYWAFSQPLGLDNAYFFQRVWQEVFLEEPVRTLLNTETGHGIWGGRHIEPLLWVAAPLVALWPQMEALLLLQVSCVGLGIVAAYGIAQHCVGDRITSVLLAAAWACQPGLWDLATTDFRSINLSVGFVALAWWGWIAGRAGWALLAGLLAMASREEVVWLVLAGLPWVVASRPKEKRLWPSLAFLGAGLFWVAFLRSTQEGPSSFVAFTELPGTVLEAVGSLDWGAERAERGAGGSLTQLQAATGAGFWLIPVAPLAALPVVASWLGKAATPDVAGPWAYHLWSVALATMALITALAVARIGRAVARVRGHCWGTRAVRFTAGGLLLLQWQGLRVQMVDYWESVPGVLLGEGRPSIRFGTPWEAILKVPDKEPVLTEAYFVAQLAAREVVYAVDDHHSDEDRAQVLSAVEWVLLRKGHEWMPLVEQAGFIPYAEGGEVRLHHRASAPGAGLNPITPE